MYYNEKLLELRIKNGLKQEDIARQLNISQRTYSHYETGEHKLPVDILIDLCRYYNVSSDYILGLNDR